MFLESVTSTRKGEEVSIIRKTMIMAMTLLLPG